jgi:hypothetical protein
MSDPILNYGATSQAAVPIVGVNTPIANGSLTSDLNAAGFTTTGLSSTFFDLVSPLQDR